MNISKEKGILVLIKNFLKNLQLAVAFLSALPVGSKAKEEINLSRTVPFFSLTGLIIGGVLVGIYYLFRNIFPIPVIAGLILITLFALTRGLHLDGLADTFDGLLGSADREESLRIMKDVKIGTFGISTIVLDMILKLVLIISINPLKIWIILLMFPALARMVAAYAVTFYPATSESGLAYEITKERSIFGFFINVIIVMVLLFFLLSMEGILILVYQLFIGILLIIFLTMKVKGLTGDILGAIIEISEIIALLIFAILIK